jgi:serine protease Do
MTSKALCIRFLKCLLLLVSILALQPAHMAGAQGTGTKTAAAAGGCPELIDLIKNITPVVVNISIERHVLQNTSQPQRPVRTHQRSSQDRFKNPDRLQNDSLGSGFFSDTHGHIVTNAHVVEGASKIVVTLSSGRVLTATVVAVHPKVDLALLRITPPHVLQKAKIGDSTNIQVGQWVLAVGNPFGLGNTVTVGIVSGKGRFLGLGEDDNFIQTDASINPGNSGGPLFNMAGEVIGVNTAIIASGKGIGFAIPASYLAELINMRRSDEPIVRGWLGIYVEDVDEQKAKALGLATPRGTLVDEVLKSTPADNAGLIRGDLIYDVDGTTIRDGRHLSRLVSGAKPGDVLRMKVMRGKKARTVDVVIGRSPE